MLRLRYFLLASVWLICGAAAAGGLQVTPISLSLLPNQRAEGLWLSNTGDATLRAQVRLYRWTQEGGKDNLVPATALTVSPPMLQVVVGDKQLVRVIRLGSPGAVQEAYRMMIDELPSAVDIAPETSNMKFVMRYSIPVFVEPAGPPAAPHKLSWAIRAESGKAVLEVTNSGASYAQISTINFTDAAGHSTEVSPGLLGYVLPSAQMRWPTVLAANIFSGGGTLEVIVNGKPTQEVIPPILALR